MPTKYCPHCGKRTGFEVRFNVSCRVGDKNEEGYLRICKVCGGRFITIRQDERAAEGSQNSGIAGSIILGGFVEEDD